MTIEECYQELGGSYAEVCTRLPSPRLVEKFAAKFLEDQSFETLCKEMEAGCRQEAFRSAHTLKGVCLNLCLTRLSESSATVTDALRSGEDHTTPAMLARFDADYAQVTQSIRTYLAEHQG